MINFNKKTIIIAIACVLALILFIFILKKQSSSISLNTQYIKMYEQDVYQLKASSDRVIWISDNPNVASVTSTGIVTAISEGEARIIVKTEDGKNSNSCVVEVVKKEVESIEFDRQELVIQKGEETNLTVIITPDDLPEKITWASSNDNIVKVLEDGKIQAIGEGIAIIKAEKLGKEATIPVFVGVKATSIKIEKSEEELPLEESIKLNVEILPKESLEEKIIWESSDPNILEVDDDGKITAKSIGNASVTAKTEYSKIKDTYYVIVTKKRYEVKFMELNETIKVKEGEKIGTLKTMSKEEYNFLGWYTEEKGGEKVTEDTIVTSNMTLYPHWEVDYCLPKDSRFNSYNTVVYSDTDTFKYRMIHYDNHDIVLIWVADATKQLKLGLAVANSKGALPAEYILREVPANKSLVAVNGSLFDEGTGSPNYGVIIHDGKVIKDEKGYGGCFGITKDSTLVECTNKSRDEMLSMGIINNFSISHTIAGGKSDGTKLIAHRTQICQVDKHNFAIISARNTKTSDAARILYGFSGNRCATIYNLDGGGSRKLYYRVKGGVLTKRFGGDRLIPDMLYFTEQ